MSVKREIVLPDDLAALVEAYRRDQPAPPPLSAVAEAALRQYLASPGRPPPPPSDVVPHRIVPIEAGSPYLRITPSDIEDDAADVSINHDQYLAGA